jgi:GDP-mannose 4,6-dehydratase
VSCDHPEYTAEVVGVGTLRLLEAGREYSARVRAHVRVYQAGSSEMYGAAAPPQNETTPFHPRSRYAVSKVAAPWFACNYREAYSLIIANGIHESPSRGETFVTRKITRAIGRIKEGLQQKLYLGNLDARRIWEFAGDYVEAMWLMLQQDEPGDYVVATDESHGHKRRQTEHGQTLSGIVTHSPAFRFQMRLLAPFWAPGTVAESREGEHYRVDARSHSPEAQRGSTWSVTRAQPMLNR